MIEMYIILSILTGYRHLRLYKKSLYNQYDMTFFIKNRGL